MRIAVGECARDKGVARNIVIEDLVKRPGCVMSDGGFTESMTQLQHKGFAKRFLSELGNSLGYDSRPRAVAVRQRVTDIATRLQPVGGPGVSQSVLDARMALGHDNTLYLQTGISILWAGEDDKDEQNRLFPSSLSSSGMSYTAEAAITREVLKSQQSKVNETLFQVIRGSVVLCYLLEFPEVHEFVMRVLFEKLHQAQQDVRNSRDEDKPSKRVPHLVRLYDWLHPGARDDDRNRKDVTNGAVVRPLQDGNPGFPAFVNTQNVNDRVVQVHDENGWDELLADMDMAGEKASLTRTVDRHYPGKNGDGIDFQTRMNQRFKPAPGGGERVGNIEELRALAEAFALLFTPLSSANSVMEKVHDLVMHGMTEMLAESYEPTMRLLRGLYMVGKGGPNDIANGVGMWANMAPAEPAAVAWRNLFNALDEDDKLNRPTSLGRKAPVSLLQNALYQKGDRLVEKEKSKLVSRAISSAAEGSEELLMLAPTASQDGLASVADQGDETGMVMDFETGDFFFSGTHEKQSSAPTEARPAYQAPEQTTLLGFNGVRNDPKWRDFSDPVPGPGGAAPPAGAVNAYMNELREALLHMEKIRSPLLRNQIGTSFFDKVFPAGKGWFGGISGGQPGFLRVLPVLVEETGVLAKRASSMLAVGLLETESQHTFETLAQQTVLARGWNTDIGPHQLRQTNSRHVEWYTYPSEIALKGGSANLKAAATPEGRAKFQEPEAARKKRLNRLRQDVMLLLSGKCVAEAVKDGNPKLRTMDSGVLKAEETLNEETSVLYNHSKADGTGAGTERSLFPEFAHFDPEESAGEETAVMGTIPSQASYRGMCWNAGGNKDLDSGGVGRYAPPDEADEAKRRTACAAAVLEHFLQRIAHTLRTRDLNRAFDRTASKPGPDATGGEDFLENRGDSGGLLAVQMRFAMRAAAKLMQIPYLGKVLKDGNVSVFDVDTTKEPATFRCVKAQDAREKPYARMLAPAMPGAR